MLYKIGEISNLLGISSESIRYYERKAGVRSKNVDDESGYRYYTALDLYALMRIRMYRNCGFSVQEAAEMLNEYSFEELADKVAGKEEDIRAAIEWNERLLAATAKMAETYRRVEGMTGKCRVENSPAMYRFPFVTRGELTGDKAALRQVKKWMDKMPVVAVTPFFAREDILLGSENFGIGMCVMEEDADYVGVREAGVELEYRPSVPSVYTVIEADRGRQLHCSMLSHVLEYMEQNGMRLSGDAIGKTVTTIHHSTTHRRAHEVWLPYEKV